MDIVADMAFVAATMLIFIRLSALFFLSPLFSVASIPVNVKIIFLLAISAMFAMSISLSDLTISYTLVDFFSAAIHEFFIGLVMAFGLFAAFAAFLFGGRILDFQMGFGVANLIDPATSAQSPLIGTLLNMLAVMVFFLLDGHHLLIRGILYSIDVLPLGKGLTTLNLDAVLRQFGMMFIFGLMLVAPIVFVLLLLDVGMAVAARTMPQVNIFIVGLPLKIGVGLIVLAISLSYWGSLLNKIYQSIFTYWEQVLL